MKPNSNTYHKVCARYSRMRFSDVRQNTRHRTFFLPSSFHFIDQHDSITRKPTVSSRSYRKSLLRKRSTLVSVNGRLSAKNERLWINCLFEKISYIVIETRQQRRLWVRLSCIVIPSTDFVKWLYTLWLKVTYGSLVVNGTSRVFSNFTLILTIKHFFYKYLFSNHKVINEKKILRHWARLGRNF